MSIAPRSDCVCASEFTFGAMKHLVKFVPAAAACLMCSCDAAGSNRDSRTRSRFINSPTIPPLLFHLLSSHLSRAPSRSCTLLWNSIVAINVIGNDGKPRCFLCLGRKRHWQPRPELKLCVERPSGRSTFAARRLAGLIDTKWTHARRVRNGLDLARSSFGRPSAVLKLRRRVRQKWQHQRRLSKRGG